MAMKRWMWQGKETQESIRKTGSKWVGLHAQDNLGSLPACNLFWNLILQIKAGTVLSIWLRKFTIAVSKLWLLWHACYVLAFFFFVHVNITTAMLTCCCSPCWPVAMDMLPKTVQMCCHAIMTTVWKWTPGLKPSSCVLKSVSFVRVRQVFSHTCPLVCWWIQSVNLITCV